MWGNSSEPPMYQELQQVLQSTSARLQSQGCANQPFADLGGSPFPGGSPFYGSPYFRSFQPSSQHFHAIPFPSTNPPMLQAGSGMAPGLSHLSSVALVSDAEHERNIARLVGLDSLL